MLDKLAYTLHSPIMLSLLIPTFLLAFTLSAALEGECARERDSNHNRACALADRSLVCPAGDVLLLRRFNGDLVVQSYGLPPTDEGLKQKKIPLDGDLARFSLTCSSCRGPSVLEFQREPVYVYVVLNDEALSVIEVNVSESFELKPTQVCVCVSGFISGEGQGGLVPPSEIG